MHLFCPFAGKFYGRNKNDQDSFLAQIGKAVALGALWGEVWQSSHKWTLLLFRLRHAVIAERRRPPLPAHVRTSPTRRARRDRTAHEIRRRSAGCGTCP